MSRVRAESRREPLDCIVRLVTPERIVIAHPLAGPSRRFVAYLIDQVLLIILALPGVLSLAVFDDGLTGRIGTDPGCLFRVDLGLRRLLRGARSTVRRWASA